ncbi:efflux RND transporter periplasmic adaptor subunit [Brevibacillus sp. SYP-B805]|uniref:efflux RND transporter periplasmic adaptor subunit n=1 Tax=Brevibacillus sp. SYP-B805 TaxID=1578199 RepID=UPI0013E9BDD0|nr:efflux RND transporter periplasmic adaptor subunit [Brevibacillus sp. SYP-B805]NGQ96201.1 efflux RND transporter periplasmic adaptor subunit [Brevibacillus sp. SYP-B805]
MKKKWLYLALIAGLLTTTACSGKDASQAEARETKTVEVTSVKREKAVRISELSGTLLPAEEALVSFEVGGRIVQLNKNEGDPVKAGEVIARIDASDYALQVERANAVVEQTGASLAKTNKGARQQELIQAKAMLDKAKIAYQKAAEDFKKYDKLYQEKAISRDAFENARDQVELAQRDLVAAEQAYSLTVQGARAEDRAMQRSSYDQAVISREQAALSLAKTQLKAPISGTVISKLTSVGELINVGTPVYRVGNIDTLKVVLPVPDHEISAWREGETVSLTLYGSKRDGKVAKIYPATNQSTGTIGVEVSIPNPQHDWFAGQVVKASKQIAGREGIFVPVEAVISRGSNHPFVYLNAGGKAVKTEVTVGELQDNQLEITSGLKEGDQVVVKGGDRLFDGDPIVVAGGSQP